MALDYQKLAANSVDVAGVMTEKFLNRFSAAHFHGLPSIYSGSYKYTSFDSDLVIDYHFQNPLVFDLAPLPKGPFARIWKSHLVQKGANLNVAPPVTPPNLQLGASDIKFLVKVYKGHTSTLDFSVEFHWDCHARCAVLLVDAQGGKAVRLEPVKIELTAHPSALLEEIRTKIAEVAAERSKTEDKERHLPTFGSPTDPVWCAKVEQLVLFLVNNILSLQFANFIREWQLPRAVELVNGVALSPYYLDIDDKKIVVGAQVKAAAARLSAIDERMQGFLAELGERLQAEFDGLTDAQVNAWDPGQSATLAWLNATHEELAALHRSDSRDLIGAASRYEENMMLLSNDRLFDALAKASLRANSHQDYSKGIDFLIKAEAGWWFNLGSGESHVVAKGIEVSAAIDMGGYARACIPNPDPKHWGQWMCVGLCVDLKPDNAGRLKLNAYPTFPADGVYVACDLQNNAIVMTFCGDVPGWVNQIAGWISSVLTAPLLAVLKLFFAHYRFAVAKYPPHFPGTALAFKPQMNQAPTNLGPYLTFSADPTFS